MLIHSNRLRALFATLVSLTITGWHKGREQSHRQGGRTTLIHLNCAGMVI